VLVGVLECDDDVRIEHFSGLRRTPGYPESVALLTMRFVFLPPRLVSGRRGLLV
jgi:hypothetical protein